MQTISQNDFITWLNMESLFNNIKTLNKVDLKAGMNIPLPVSKISFLMDFLQKKITRLLF